jgi:hypothetical protein
MPLIYQETKDDNIVCKCNSCGEVLFINKTQLKYINSEKYDINSGIKCKCGSYYTGVDKCTNFTNSKQSNNIIWAIILGVLLIISVLQINSNIKHNNNMTSMEKYYQSYPEQYKKDMNDQAYMEKVKIELQAQEDKESLNK